MGQRKKIKFMVLGNGTTKMQTVKAKTLLQVHIFQSSTENRTVCGFSRFFSFFFAIPPRFAIFGAGGPLQFS
jgi:hypothetical protein